MGWRHKKLFESSSQSVAAPGTASRLNSLPLLVAAFPGNRRRGARAGRCPRRVRPDSAKRRKIAQRLRERNDIRVLCVEVEQTLGMRRSRTIAYRFVHDDGPEPILACVHCGCPDTAAGGGACEQDGVCSKRRQPGEKVGSKKARRVLLVQHAIRGSAVESFIQMMTVSFCHETGRPLLLDRADARVTHLRVVVANGREEDWHLGSVSCVEQPIACVDLGRQVSAEGAGSSSSRASSPAHEECSPETSIAVWRRSVWEAARRHSAC